MTLREQASERLTDATLQFAWPDLPLEDCQDARDVVLDALQPLFDQVEREKAAAITAANVAYARLAAKRIMEVGELVEECDAQRARVAELEARLGLRSWDVEAGQWVPAEGPTPAPGDAEPFTTTVVKFGPHPVAAPCAIEERCMYPAPLASETREQFLQRVAAPPDDTLARVAPTWQPIETAPQMRKIMVTYANALGKRRTVLACYYKAHSLEMHDDYQDVGEYDDASGCSFAPEGWYEEHESEEPLMSLQEDPTHWMPLPDPPVEALRPDAPEVK